MDINEVVLNTWVASTDVQKVWVLCRLKDPANMVISPSRLEYRGLHTMNQLARKYNWQELSSFEQDQLQMTAVKYYHQDWAWYPSRIPRKTIIISPSIPLSSPCLFFSPTISFIASFSSRCDAIFSGHSWQRSSTTMIHSSQSAAFRGTIVSTWAHHVLRVRCAFEAVCWWILAIRGLSIGEGEEAEGSNEGSIEEDHIGVICRSDNRMAWGCGLGWFE